jgi:hypothetical protein
LKYGMASFDLGREDLVRCKMEACTGGGTGDKLSSGDHSFACFASDSDHEFLTSHSTLLP